MNIMLSSIPEIKPLTQWVEIPINVKVEDSIGVLELSDQAFYAQIIDNVIYIKSTMRDFGIYKGAYKPIDGSKPIPFIMSDWITDDITEIIPSFQLTYQIEETGETVVVESIPPKFALDMNQDVPQSIIIKQKENNVKITFASKFIFPGISLSINMESSIYSQQDILPFNGSIVLSDDRKITIKQLTMLCREEIAIDDARLHSLESSYLGTGKWASDILVNYLAVPAVPMNKRFSGVLLCRSAKSFDRERLLVLKSRSAGRIIGGVSQ